MSPKRLLVVKDRNYWASFEQSASKENDAVFAIDFGLYLKLKNEGFRVFFFDCFLDSNYMQALNQKMHDFLNNWFMDEQGNDRLVYKNYALGDAFKLSILSDVTYFCHFFLNFQGLLHLKCDEIIVSTDTEMFLIFQKTGIPFTYIVPEKMGNIPSYLFPIKKWMAEKVNPKSLSMQVKKIVATCFDYFFYFIDKILPAKRTVFIQEYFCTNPIIKQLRSEGRFRVITSNYSGIKNIIAERRILYRSFADAEKESASLLQKVKSSQGIEWIENGVNIASYLYEIIFIAIERELKEACSCIESMELFFNKRKPAVMVPISDLWLKNRLMITFCKKNNIPIFYIVNGLLSLSFWQEAKDADWINAYGEAAKRDFFRNDSRVVTLGDPRMDAYAGMPHKAVNYDSPTILIGTSAFNLIDLNSFVAVEFEFIYCVLAVLEKMLDAGRSFQIELKIRSNGYQHLYESFAAEYFPRLNIRFYQNESFESILEHADLYISFYSQTLIEAAARGIPSIYFKNDRQIMLPPFDGKSEVVTVLSEKELMEKVNAFFERSEIFYAFCERTVIEKYMGQLDGKNVIRNVDFINQLAPE